MIIFAFLVFGTGYYVGVILESPLVAAAIGIIMISLFFWNRISRSKKAAQRKHRERMFLSHMRMTHKNQWH
ncbi:hypothetical protein [Pedobacter gandavensis]|uniref:hypothetical protein n=1 Tax=Pedobacter gandavensis TaxID=2679963 RepID=UPI002931F685|nr:hypothetical protein [Pedobacter gandavensis]